MSPSIRYTKSADGSSIAYWTIGDGRPLVYMPMTPWSHLEREWAIPEWRERYERLAVGRQLVRYDSRGFGLSEARPADVTLEAHVSDLLAVLDVLDIAECDLLANGDSGMAAIEFCAQSSTRVGKLILWNSYANRRPLNDNPKIRSIRALWDEDWHTYTETAIGIFFQWKHPERASVIADLYRAAATQESLREVVGELRNVDVTSRLSAVAVPTLVVSTDGYFIDLRDETRRIAAGLPNAQMKTVPGSTGMFDFFEAEDVLVTEVNKFLGGPTDAQLDGVRTTGPRTAATIRTVLFTDIVGHTEMMQRLGDAKGRDVLREHERIVRDTLLRHGGDEVKTMGDGFMASFASISNAVECAIVLQRAFVEAARFMSEPLNVRIGLNAGEPIAEDGDLFGSTVILAARIAAFAGAGEILVPDHVRMLLSGKAISFQARGEFAPKGFDESVTLFEVLWRDSPTDNFADHDRI